MSHSNKPGGVNVNGYARVWLCFLFVASACSSANNRHSARPPVADNERIYWYSAADRDSAGRAVRAADVPPEHAILVSYGVINTRVGHPPLPAALRIDSYEDGDSGPYLVQFRHPRTTRAPDWLTPLTEEHAVIANNTFIARMSQEQHRRAQAKDGVQWIGLLQPAYRIHPALLRVGPGPHRVRVDMFAAVSASKVAAIYELWKQWSVRVLSRDTHSAVVEAPQAMLFRIARMSDVRWIEPR